MKKLIKIIVLTMLTIGSLSCQSSAEREEKKAVKVLKEYLQKKYDEEFEVGYIGVRKVGNDRQYEADIIPKSIIDTPKEFDEYYWAKGFVKITAGGLIPEDSYSRVLLNISANEFFGKKLEELFGKNYLAAINVEGHYEYLDYKREITRRSQVHKASPQGKYAPISGSIFIFGKVLNDADREGYREKIYKLIEFFKENGSFEYMALWIVILDERVLSDAFINSYEDQSALLNLYEEKGEKYIREIEEIIYKYPNTFDKDSSIIEQIEKLYKNNGEKYLKEKFQIMSKYDESYLNTSDENRQRKILEMKKNQITKSIFYNKLLVSPIFSPKHIKINGIKIIRYSNFENIKDVYFTEEIYYRRNKNEQHQR